LLSSGLVFLHQRCLVAAAGAEALGTLVLLIPGAGSGAGTSLLLLRGLAAAREYEIAVHR
jgi:glycerol uptake facilitator-like aquaporin